MHFFSRPETAGLACFRQASRSRWLSSGLLSGMMAGELGGLPRRQGGRAWTGAGPDLRGGFPPDSGREPGFLRRKPGRKESRGDAPRPPWVMARSLLARSFWRLCRIVPVDRLLRAPSTCPDLETFFCKILFQHIFSGKCVPNRSWHTGGNSPTIVPKTTIPKTSERE